MRITPKRMAAQRERIAVAGRNLADAEHADQRFQLVGQRDHGADPAAWQRCRRRSVACNGLRSRRPRRAFSPSCSA
jgi:hypothetical protein